MNKMKINFNKWEEFDESFNDKIINILSSLKINPTNDRIYNLDNIVIIKSNSNEFKQIKNLMKFNNMKIIDSLASIQSASIFYRIRVNYFFRKIKNNRFKVSTSKYIDFNDNNYIGWYIDYKNEKIEKI